MRLYPFSEVIADSTSKFRKIKASDYKDEGRFRIIDQGQKAVAGYTDDSSLVNRTHSPIIIFGDHTRTLKYENSPIALGADGAKALSVNPKIANPQYIYYYLRTINLKGAGYSRHFKFLKQIEIPIPEKNGEPDINEQVRIAHLLGKVEGLIALRKQHLQQLDDLLKSVFLAMFGDPVRNEKGWETIPFHKIGKFISGATPSKGRDDFWDGSYPWVSPKDMKVSKIIDSIDHISEAVFDETTLKRITPNHLLIVVRGMILAHSFPVAINTVEIAINQDMKAIKPVKGVNVVYLQNCVIALKRQILKLISTAGHGTRKFDAVAMQKLFVPKPPPELQNQFATIVEKVEVLKSRYQQSLYEIESLYGTLSQQAFKGELDLSQVPLPEPEQPADEVAMAIPEPEAVDQTLVIHLPESDSLPDALTNKEQRKELFAFWLESYCQQIGNTPFSASDFLAAAQTRIADLHPDNEFEFGLDDYDQIKNWVFEALESGKLKQERNQVYCVIETKETVRGNLVELKSGELR